ncbi:MAG: peroxiredoxin [Sphingomonadales bacterium]
MIRFVHLATVAAVAIARPVLAALPVGAAAPDFATQGAMAGKTFPFSLAQALKKGPVVLYFFPKAFTTGCTIETKAFADASDDFRKAGAQIVGVAADPIEDLQRFSTEACRSKFPVAVASAKMIADYDVALPLMPRSNRTSFVIARNGKIAYMHSEMKPDGHITGTLAAVRALKGAKGK